MKGIITLCGSTRFVKEFEEARLWLTIEDWIVLTVGGFLHGDKDPNVRELLAGHKEQLDRLHKEKIAMSDYILVLDVNGYIGESTRSEIEYAEKLQKKIYYWSESLKLGGIKPMLAGSDSKEG